MKPRDLTDLLLLAAIWGASFLFLRIAVPEFGPIALIEVRVGIAAAFLLPLLVWRGELSAVRANAWRLFVVGVLNSALPFVLLSYALLHITVGLAAIVNAMVPMWTALIGRLWLRDRLAPLQWLGLVIGVLGVVALVWGRVSLRPDSVAFDATLGIGACVIAAASYAIAANYTKRYLSGLGAYPIAGGSQLGATLALVPFSLIASPAQISALSWVAAITLGVLCTGVAYLLYFRLLRRVGPMRAASVTFLVPVTATLWGTLLLGEEVTVQMLVGGAVILAGTALALNLLGVKREPATVTAA